MKTLDGLLRAMEKMYEPQEKTFEITRIIYNLQETCPIHHVGSKNLKLQRYVCPICSLSLTKTLRQ